MIRSARPVPAGVPLATHPSAISVCEPMIREILLTGLKKGIGLAIDRSHKRAFVGDLGGSVRMIALDIPGEESVVFSGHGPLTGIAYLGE